MAWPDADETGYWLELVMETSAISPRTVSALVSEAEQLARMVVASIKTARGRSR
jgi:four helix bundle protein